LRPRFCEKVGIPMKMKTLTIMKNDEVYVLTGKDKGKTGKVMSVDPRNEKVTVEGINLAKKHQKPRRRGASGEVVDIPMPIHFSNLRLVCPNCKEPVRPRKRTQPDSDKRFRACPKCGKFIEKTK
jgi:large subunit ribosomal protein L24